MDKTKINRAGKQQPVNEKSQYQSVAGGSIDDIPAMKKLPDKLGQEGSEPISAPSIRQQVINNKKLIDKTTPISLEDKHMNAVQSAKLVKEILEDNNGIVSREDIGDIQVGNRIKKGLAYIHTKAEIAAIFAVPEILAKGVIIHKTADHKARGYSTITIANRVLIGSTSGVIAVVITQTEGNFYKVHRVFAPDGKTLVI